LKENQKKTESQHLTEGPADFEYINGTEFLYQFSDVKTTPVWIKSLDLLKLCQLIQEFGHKYALP